MNDDSTVDKNYHDSPFDQGEHQHQTNNDLHDQKGKKRNIWNEKRNSYLVELVKHCRYPTPWRPKHGTSKEIWQEITDQINARTDIFEAPVQWESAKEQLMKIIERQKLRRSLGDYTVKSETESYVDEMIKHMVADDEEKAKLIRRQQERSQKRLLRRHMIENTLSTTSTTATMSMLPLTTRVGTSMLPHEYAYDSQQNIQAILTSTIPDYTHKKIKYATSDNYYDSSANNSSSSSKNRVTNTSLLNHSQHSTSALTSHHATSYLSHHPNGNNNLHNIYDRLHTNNNHYLYDVSSNSNHDTHDMILPTTIPITLPPPTSSLSSSHIIPITTTSPIATTTTATIDNNNNRNNIHNNDKTQSISPRFNSASTPSHSVEMILQPSSTTLTTPVSSKEINVNISSTTATTDEATKVYDIKGRNHPDDVSDSVLELDTSMSSGHVSLPQQNMIDVHVDMSSSDVHLSNNTITMKDMKKSRPEEEVNTEYMHDNEANSSPEAMSNHHTESNPLISNSIDINVPITANNLIQLLETFYQNHAYIHVHANNDKIKNDSHTRDMCIDITQSTRKQLDKDISIIRRRNKIELSEDSYQQQQQLEVADNAHQKMDIHVDMMTYIRDIYEKIELQGQMLVKMMTMLEHMSSSSSFTKNDYNTALLDPFSSFTSTNATGTNMKNIKNHMSDNNNNNNNNNRNKNDYDINDTNELVEIQMTDTNVNSNTCTQNILSPTTLNIHVDTHHESLINIHSQKDNPTYSRINTHIIDSDTSQINDTHAPMEGTDENE